MCRRAPAELETGTGCGPSHPSVKHPAPDASSFNTRVLIELACGRGARGRVKVRSVRSRRAAVADPGSAAVCGAPSSQVGRPCRPLTPLYLSLSLSLSDALTWPRRRRRPRLAERGVFSPSAATGPSPSCPVRLSSANQCVGPPVSVSVSLSLPFSARLSLRLSLPAWLSAFPPVFPPSLPACPHFLSPFQPA